MTQSPPSLVPAMRQGRRRTTKRERLARRHDALAQLAKGASFRSVVVFLTEKYEVSSRTAERDLAWCRDRLLHDLEGVDAVQLLAWWGNRVQQLTHEAAEAGNYNAAMAGMKLIFEGFLRREIDKKYHLTMSKRGW